jgi:hypothetical protein
MVFRLTLISVFVAACGDGGGGGDDAATSMTGQAVYRDARTDHTGQAQPASSPPAQDATLSIVVEGNGQIPQVDPQCALDPAGAFEAHYSGTLALSDDAAYASSVASTASSIVTPSGCAIPDLTVGVITDVKIHAELAVNTTNCQSYCSAAARADAEESCGATASAAECRSTAEASAEASCNTTCTTEAHSIVAEASLSAALLGQLDANALRAAALGDFEADLEFDHLEDSDGNLVDF